ncbi:hypothetical protein P4O66_009898 [Electrophorus voltai]|uniref:DNA-directed DNA polymerase n=1 Tax=Electrophorus voltai TaxID=2609070 RepID=A0AAD8ZB88_9TELE|nr:hypothetical protein P4O66_009898 [Electrophorus voltai]
MYPIGHPVILYRDFGSLENYFGIIKVILPGWLMKPQKRVHSKYEENEGIKLEEEEISVNLVKRSVAKLTVNSLWGKICQKADRTNMVLLRDPDEFLEYMFSNLYDGSHFSSLNDEVALMQ